MGQLDRPNVEEQQAVNKDGITATEKRPKESTEHEREFGGTIGTTFIILSSHIFIFVMTSTLYGTDVSVYKPTARSLTWFGLYHISQWVLARIMPGVWVTGQSGLGYLCNAYCCFYTTLAGAVVLHVVDIFDLTILVSEFPAFVSTAVLLGDVYTIVVHLYYAPSEGKLFSIYDFFMGVGLHPRIGIVDVKMVAETRVSWTLLLLFTLGSYIDTARRLGAWFANPVLFMVLAHGLYANACAKGEHFIPYTWDLTTEKFGWMLCWWNLAGVPLLYCYQSLFLARYAWDGLTLPMPALPYYCIISVLLLLAYWIWDEANYHKCYFKCQQRGEIPTRRLFPTFRHVENPKYIKCDVGVLLIDGWYGWARKIHYTADVCMALLWGLSCGVGSALPFVYFGFFVTMITHRASRDEARCREKYGATWDKYLKAVPYRFVPGVW